MIAQTLSVPPERAGRWLVRRLETARRAADLLDRKLKILQGELSRRRAAAAQTAARWDSCQADAEKWLLRASLLGGQRAIRLGGDSLPADVTITYANPWGSATRPRPHAPSRRPPPGTGRCWPRRGGRIAPLLPRPSSTR